MIILLIFIATISTRALADNEIKCNGSGNQLELNVCAHDDFAKADRELNQAYQSIIKKEVKDRLFINQLRKSQKAWVVFRDADLAAKFTCAEKDVRICWGSMYPVSFSTYKTELTRERTKHLQQFLQEGN